MKRLVTEFFVCNDCPEEKKKIPNRKAALLHYKQTKHEVKGAMIYAVEYGVKKDGRDEHTEQSDTSPSD